PQVRVIFLLWESDQKCHPALKEGPCFVSQKAMIAPERREGFLGQSAWPRRWYWGSMNVAEAKERLQDTPEGTFLVRDSSHLEYLLTISVKTSAGPTNLHIEYQDIKFRLDSIICVRSRLKQFDSVVHLIEYYVLTCEDRKIWPETPLNETVHLYLNKPLCTSTLSLQHQFLKEYQYQV
uniref:SH2 domain-containing protein n=1 Tax=Chelydra serpentina TaxID=8475 RepID=A0A8C3S3R7_CHESE